MPAFTWAATAAVALAACTPSLNWRDVPLAEGLQATLPCRPQSSERSVTLAGQPVQMTLKACDAEGSVWAVSTAIAAGGDADHAQRALEAMRQALVANLEGRVVETPASPAAPAPQPGGLHPAVLQIEGRHPDGSAAQARAAFARSGTRVFQLVVLPKPGERLPPDAALEYFFQNLRSGRASGVR